MSKSIYEELSAERKQMQAAGKLPDWFTTGSWQMFKSTYMYEADGYFEQIQRISKAMAKQAPKFLPKKHPYHDRIVSEYGDTWEKVFYEMMAKGHLAPSSPVLSNGGTKRGCAISCSGGYIGDSIASWYEASKETALLTKEGFGTSGYLGDIRPRGSKITGGGVASGSLPCLTKFAFDAGIVSQAGVRRGSWAGYIEIDHDDFDEWADHLHKDPQGLNIGWNVTKDFIQKCEDGDEDSIRRFQKALFVKMQTGKGYFWKIDHANDALPDLFKAVGQTIKGSNLCSEIALPSDEEHTFSCVLSSLNLIHYDKIKTSGAVFASLVFLDCVISDFLITAKNIKGFEKIVRFTEKARALGLGTLGFHSYLQRNMMPFESFDAHMMNTEIFKHLDDESKKASEWLAEVLGEPEWCVGYGIRNGTRLSLAPNMSSAVLASQSSQSIEPIIANVFMQSTPAGEMQRINPQFLKIMDERGKHTKATIRSIIDNTGSVQHLSWLSDHEKSVFKTAFEIDQRVILRLASIRQRYIDQGQSLNLFFSADESEEYIAQIHKEAFLDSNIKGLYYIRTLAGVQAAKDECIACEG